MVISTDLLGRKKQIIKDIYGNVIRVTDDYNGSDSITTSYNYDDFSRLKTVVETSGATTTINYDVLNRKTSMTTPDTGTSSYTYNDFGDMKTQTDAKGQMTSYFYDVSGRLDIVKYADGLQTSFVYGTTGNLKGQLQEECGIGYTNSYNYDIPTRVIMPKGVSLPLAKILLGITLSRPIPFRYGWERIQ